MVRGDRGFSGIARCARRIAPRLLDAMPARFVVAEGDVQMNTVLLDIDESTGRARSIQRLNFRLD